MPRPNLSLLLVLLLTTSGWPTAAGELLREIDVADEQGELAALQEPLYFLRWLGRDFGPDAWRDARGNRVPVSPTGDSQAIALFQGLEAYAVAPPVSGPSAPLRFTRFSSGPPLLRRVIQVDSRALAAPRFQLVESGDPLSSLPPHVRSIDLTAEELQAQQQRLDDPVLANLSQEASWRQLESAALPLDFQKILLAGPHDPSPGFAFQNGQWFTTWLSKDLPKWTKEDHWFAPALLIGDQLIRPAPLSAKLRMERNAAGRELPLLQIEWAHNGARVRQELFSHQDDHGRRGVCCRLSVRGGGGAKLALGTGRRPNAHYWDDKTRPRTPLPFATLRPRFRRAERRLVDDWGNLLLQADQTFTLEALGPLERLLVFTSDPSEGVSLWTPQQATSSDAPPETRLDYATARDACIRRWSEHLNAGGQIATPDSRWRSRTDAWLTQVESITRVPRQGRDHLQYGAYFYEAFFGPEEGWPIVALAQWGRGAEAQRQAEVLLADEHRDKQNPHHQARNGSFAWHASEVARLTRDAEWLQRVSPALIENADWTIAACDSTLDAENPTVRGLLPPHIYGGDIRDPATSLYATLVCWKGLAATADAFLHLGGDQLRARGQVYADAAAKLRSRLSNVIASAAVPSTSPPFLPLALALPSREGRHEGPYPRLTDTRLGNYWNLFAPQVLELDFRSSLDPSTPNRWLLQTMQRHGGMWGGMPRFYDGVDVAYSLGGIRSLIHASANEPGLRVEAVNALQSFLANGASRVGGAIPEVVSLYPERLNQDAYLELVRRAPWSLGMHDSEHYLRGHISFTEPLGAAAGAGLWLIRDSLVHETRADSGALDGGLFLLAAAPESWFSQGRQVQAESMATPYGDISFTTTSRVDSSGRIELRYSFTGRRPRQAEALTVRFAPPGRPVRDVRVKAAASGVVQVAY